MMILFVSSLVHAFFFTVFVNFFKYRNVLLDHSNCNSQEGYWLNFLTASSKYIKLFCVILNNLCF